MSFPTTGSPYQKYTFFPAVTELLTNNEMEIINIHI